MSARVTSYRGSHVMSSTWRAKVQSVSSSPPEASRWTARRSKHRFGILPARNGTELLHQRESSHQLLCCVVVLLLTCTPVFVYISHRFFVCEPNGGFFVSLF